MIKNRLLISKSDRVEITVFVGLDKKGKIVANTKKEEILEDKQIDTKESDLLQVKMWFRKPSYGDDVDIISNSIIQKIDKNGESISVDTAKIRNYRFKQLLTDWDLTDDSGNPLEINEENIYRLDPAFAGAALNALEEIFGN